VGKTVADWLLNLPVPWMAVVVFAATYLFAAGIYLIVISLAVSGRAQALKAVSRFWNNFDKAKAAVATEASALRAVVLLAGTFPEEQKARIYALINRHIEVAVNQEWPEMAPSKRPSRLYPRL
jgi:hypothetical protein